MKHAWRIGRIAGIDTYVHFSFALLVAWAAIEAFQRSASGWGALFGVLFLLAVFASVVAHELGHALTARWYGIRTERIVLSPLGGVAQMERMPADPRQEMAVAAAGPLVSIALAGGFGLVSAWAGGGLGAFVGALAAANLLLAVFNLIPMFPSDGGRIFRAWLAWRTHYVDATAVAVKVGQAAAIGLGAFGLLTGSLMLSVVAAFLYFMAWSERARAGVPNPTWRQVWAVLKSAVRSRGRSATDRSARSRPRGSAPRTRVVYSPDRVSRGFATDHGWTEATERQTATWRDDEVVQRVADPWARPRRAHEPTRAWVVAGAPRLGPRTRVWLWWR
ncbi:MAG: site-2 protease family protein [Myxococcales bacterium FL481]|nr:MAG: site-2 protease family protein [Myxococcales bacterium FL481]